MLDKRGDLQELLTKIFDFGFFAIEKGTVISAIGYAANQVDTIAFHIFYNFLQMFFCAGLYLRMRQTFFDKLDKEQKEASSIEESAALIPQSYRILGIGCILIVFVFNYFTSVMSMKIAH